MFKRVHAGTSSTYIEGIDKVTGRAKFTFDLTLPGMLVGKLLYSEYPHVGGGFGGKDELHTQAPVGLLAYKAGRPVKLIRSRRESMHTHVKRQRFFIRYKTGAKRDGTLTAIEVEAVLDAGPYTNASLPVAGFAAEHAAGCYNVPHARIDSYAVATNNLNGGAMRGFGGPEMAFAQEQNLDILAEQIGMDPLEIRLKNGLENGSVTPTGAEVYYDIGLKESMRRAAQAANWQERARWLVRQPAPHLRRGLGMASILHGMSIARTLMDYSRCCIEMAPDGSVVLQTGTADIGSGARTAQLLMAADALGVRPEDIRLTRIDTETTPDAGPTTASRSTYMVGKAILQAATNIRNSLLEAAGEELEAAVEDLEIGEGRITVRGAPERGVSVKTAARKAWESNKPLRGEGHAVYWQPPKPISEYTYPAPHSIFAFATQIVQALVDIEIGQVTVEKVWAAHDVGKVINRLGALGQIYGGIVQGLGMALMEELQQEEGRLMNASLEGYLVPTAMESPEIVPMLLETPHPDGPFGAVGLGEQTLDPTAAAIANAVADAIGVRLFEIPMTPERVLAALGTARGAED